MNNKKFTYAGYPIPKSFILKLKYKKHLTAHVINRLIYRAVHYAEWIRQNKGERVELVRIMSKGISKGWLFNETPDEEFNKPYVLGWIEQEIYGKEKQKKKRGGFTKAVDRMKLPDTIGDILKDVLSPITLKR